MAGGLVRQQCLLKRVRTGRLEKHQPQLLTAPATHVHVFVPESQALGQMCQLSKAWATQSQRQHLLHNQGLDKIEMYLQQSHGLLCTVGLLWPLEVPYSHMASAFIRKGPQTIYLPNKCQR